MKIYSKNAVTTGLILSMQITSLPSTRQSDVYQPYSQQFDIDNFFSLKITQRKRSTKIEMHLRQQQVDTEHIPAVVDLLESNLPSVLRTTCYNELDLPFDVEVRNTEIGHLFEHILLEYLCQAKLEKGALNATYAGRTKWNWYKDPRGTFHIHLSCGQKDSDILPKALDKTIWLVKLILEANSTSVFIPQQTFAANGLKNGSQSQPTTK